MGQIKSRPEQEKVRQGRKASSQPAAVQRKQASEAGRRATLCERAIRYRRSSGGQYHDLSYEKKIKKANGLKDADAIYEGQCIVLPDYK